MEMCIRDRLIADDDAEIREILSILLKGEGYQVVTASDGDAVVALSLIHILRVSSSSSSFPLLSR